MSILFLGSSIIQKWNTEKAFPNSINLGICGIRSSDLVPVYSKLFSIPPPSSIRNIVLYCGSNDFNDRSAAEGGILIANTVINLIEFINYLHSHFPKTTIHYMGIIKSPDRTYSQMKMIDRCNQDMKKWIKSVEYVQYVNTATIIANTHAHFRKDGRHLTKIGYENLARLLYSKILKI